MNEDKSIAESRESQQILTILEENALVECITQFAILNHSLKHSFIHEFMKEI